MAAKRKTASGRMPAGRSGASSGSPGARRPWTVAVAAGVAAAAAVFFLLGYCGILPVLVAPLIAGAIVGLVCTDLISAGIAGAAGGLVGGLVAAASYSQQAVIANFQAAPPYANPDVLAQQLYGGLVSKLLQANPIGSGNPGAAAVVLVAGVLTPAVAAGVVYGLGRLGSRRELGMTAGGWAVVSLLAIVFVATGWNYASTFRDSLAVTPASGAYAYDAYIYQETYRTMLQGDNYYDGFLKAASGDARLIKEKAIRNGKFYAFVSSPTLMREPWAFYLWRVVAPNGPPGVFLAALIACAGVMLVTYWGFSDLSTTASLLGPVLLYPVLLLSASWMNIFFPDLWAGVAMIASLAFLVRRHLITAVAFALAAALFRETLVIWLLAVLVLAALQRKSAANGTRDLIVAASALAVFAGLYGLHYVQASQIIAPEANAGAGGFIERLIGSSQMSLEGKFLAPMWYMMWPYGFFKIPGPVLAVLGIGGFAVGLRQDRLLAWTVAGYGALWFAYYATIGAASSYWGQQVMPLYLLGMALLVASVGLLDRGATELP